MITGEISFQTQAQDNNSFRMISKKFRQKRLVKKSKFVWRKKNGWVRQCRKQKFVKECRKFVKECRNWLICRELIEKRKESFVCSSILAPKLSLNKFICRELIEKRKESFVCSSILAPKLSLNKFQVSLVIFPPKASLLNCVPIFPAFFGTL